MHSRVERSLPVRGTQTGRGNWTGRVLCGKCQPPSPTRKDETGPPARGLSGHERKYDDVRGQGFWAQARRERRAYPSWVCQERPTKPAPKRTAARRVAPNLAWSFVAPRSQPHFGGCSLGACLRQAQRGRQAPRPRPNWAQRTSSYICSWPLSSRPAGQRILTLRWTEKPRDQRRHRLQGHRAAGFCRCARRRAETVAGVDCPLTGYG